MTFTPDWLALREPADAQARSQSLLPPLRAALMNQTPLTVRDVGCGTGSMARWLSPRLPTPQHWVLQDRDPALLALAGRTVTGADVTVETLAADLTHLSASDLADTDLVTASALLDVLTADQVTALAQACAGRPALFTLSVTGVVDLTPAHPLDSAFRDAFNAHQRRDALLGPAAVAVATAAFESLGAEVLTAPSPWELDQSALTAEWLRGWVSAAVEQDPTLAESAPAYVADRLSGDLHAVIHHTDLLALPGGAR